jgi:hypothetical protein
VSAPQLGGSIVADSSSVGPFGLLPSLDIGESGTRARLTSRTPSAVTSCSKPEGAINSI